MRMNSYCNLIIAEHGAGINVFSCFFILPVTLPKLPRQVKSEKSKTPVLTYGSFGCGIGIRTPTNRVRVCRATVTQFRNASERMILYQILFFLSILFYDFVKKFHFGAACEKRRRTSACRRTALFVRRESFTLHRARNGGRRMRPCRSYIPRRSRSIAPFSRRDT